MQKEAEKDNYLGDPCFGEQDEDEDGEYEEEEEVLVDKMGNTIGGAAAADD